MTFFRRELGVSMKVKSTGHSAEFLKRKAKSLSKSRPISHTEALNLVAKESGHENWNHFINCSASKPVRKVEPQRPKVPEPAALNYHNVITGAVIGQHPNRKMSVRHHKRAGFLLRELLDAVDYHKRAKKVLQDIRNTLDTWLGCEYNEVELDNREFNSIYYGNNRHIAEVKPSLKRQAELRRKLRAIKSIIDYSYHDCKPLEKLYQRFELAAKALDKWPNKIKTPSQYSKGQLRPGTFVRIPQLKKIGIVFHHDERHQLVTGYTDAGPFDAGRHEVMMLKKQLSLADFKPMRLCLPYGKWKRGDGSEVLFNRDYCPIWQKSASGEVTAIQPDVYVQYQSSTHYYDDRSAPYYDNEQTPQTCLSVLKDWGVNEKFPEVLRLLPTAIASGDIGLLSPRGAS
ncbi:DUF5623 domain-containing protein [Parapedobacter sp. GCM10030251]|uniref:DUF5623 domain-containing protein n=1 Tax=Parapedobacter sp. GCM10030251 TaxID=3273419 RepID=UPI003613AD21